MKPSKFCEIYSGKGFIFGNIIPSSQPAAVRQGVGGLIGAIMEI